jgi:hypothetical protein
LPLASAAAGNNVVIATAKQANAEAILIIAKCLTKAHLLSKPSPDSTRIAQEPIDGKSSALFSLDVARYPNASAMI